MADESTLPANTQARSYMTTQSENPIMDTAAYEHMARIATTMALSGMMHKTLIMTGQKGSEVMLPERVIAARAFLIVEQAARWGQSPFAIMQGASFVHGRLMWEGKIVAAILTEVFGIKLDYHFGTWDAKSGHVILPGKEEREPGESDQLGVIVCAEGENPLTSRKTVEGFVGQWKTTGAGSPWQPGAIKRQMRYRGAREWARAFKSAAILGVVTNDEPIEAADITPTAQKPSLSEKLAIGSDDKSQGFNAEAIKAEVGEKPRRGRPPKSETKADEEPKKAEPETEQSGAENEPEPEEPQAQQDEEPGAETAKESDDAADEADFQTEVAEQEKPGPIALFLDEMRNCVDWTGISRSFMALYKDETFNALESADQREIYRQIWEIAESKSNGEKLHLEYPTAFRIWAETQESADEIVAAARTIEKSAAYAKLPEPSKKNFGLTVDNFVKRLGGAQ